MAWLFGASEAATGATVAAEEAALAAAAEGAAGAGGSGSLAAALQMKKPGWMEMEAAGRAAEKTTLAEAVPGKKSAMKGQLSEDDIAELSKDPDFWTKFGRVVTEKGEDFLKGAAKGVGRGSQAPLGRFGSAGHSIGPMGPLPSAFQSGGLSALSRAIIGRG
jgi:hypothetical protein